MPTAATGPARQAAPIQIDYGSGTGSTELDTSGFTNPAGKNADDLVQYAIHAYEEHWGYVWGTFGHVLTESLFEAKLAQYPDALAGNADFIRRSVGRRQNDGLRRSDQRLRLAGCGDGRNRVQHKRYAGYHGERNVSCCDGFRYD
ncbi:MAG: hypothetical protein ACLRYD_16315 [Ruminococcus callidus]